MCCIAWRARPLTADAGTIGQEALDRGKLPAGQCALWHMHTLSAYSSCVALQIGPQPFSWDAWARPEDLKTRKLPPNPRKHLFRNKYQQQQQPLEARLRWEQQAYSRQDAQQALPRPRQAQPPRGVQMPQQAELPQGAHQLLHARRQQQVQPPRAVNLRPRQVQLRQQLPQQAQPPRGVHFWPRQGQHPEQAQSPLASPGKRQRSDADQPRQDKMTSPEVRLPLPVLFLLQQSALAPNSVCPICMRA